MTLQAKLHELYLLDVQLRGLTGRMNGASRRRDAQQKKLEQLARQHAELAHQHKQQQAHASTLEKAAREIEQRVAKHREAMNAVKSNKEYSALLVEVNTLKLEQGKQEEAALEQMTKVEQLTAELATAAQRVTDQQKIVAVADKEVEAARAEISTQLDELTTKRHAAAAAVPPDVLKEFERLANAYEGEAMAQVEVQDKRRHEYTCGGCYMQIPFERVNLLLSKPDAFSVCTSCQRILYVADEFRESLLAK